MTPRAVCLADGPPRTPDTAGMGQVCHPYEPGFAQCVGVPEPARWNPYGPGLPTPWAPPVRPAPDAGLVIPPVEGWMTRVEDELTLAPAQPVPEPSAMALLVVALVLCAPRRWRRS